MLVVFRAAGCVWDTEIDRMLEGRWDPTEIALISHLILVLAKNHCVSDLQCAQDLHGDEWEAV